MDREATYEISQEPLITSKVTFDIFLEQENPADLIALYHFYYYTAKWQRSTSCKATTAYVAAGLHWSEPKVRKTKKILIDLGFIEDKTLRDPKSKAIIGHYIKVHFVWTKSHPVENAQCGFGHSVANQGTNALLLINEMHLTNKKIHNAHMRKSVQEITPKNFENFWQLYPKKKFKGLAEKEWLTLCKAANRPTWPMIRRAIQAQIKTEQWKDIMFVPNPNKWLKNHRWLDDPEQMNRPTKFSNLKPKSGFTSNEPLKYKEAIKI